MKSILFKIVVAVGLSFSAAQSLTSSGSTISTSILPAATYTVSVGVDNAYQPAIVMADVGDVISNNIPFWI
jgi:hypothetical protein